MESLWTQPETLYGLRTTVIQTYSFESNVAEKFDAIVNEDEWQKQWKCDLNWIKDERS